MSGPCCGETTCEAARKALAELDRICDGYTGPGAREGLAWSMARVETGRCSFCGRPARPAASERKG